MQTKTTLPLAWRSLWELRRTHSVSTGMRLLAASLLAVALALGLMSTVAVFGHVDRPDWWMASLLPNIGICLCIVHTLLATLRSTSACCRRRWSSACRTCATSVPAWRSARWRCSASSWA